MNSFVCALAAKPETAGVGFLGGMASTGWRPFADEWSDVDISLLLDLPLPADICALSWGAFVCAVQPFLPDWLPNFKFVLPSSGVEINLHQHILQYERRADVLWDDEKCEAYGETLEVVTEKHGALTRLVFEKTLKFPTRQWDSLMWLATYGRNVITHGMTKVIGRGRLDAAYDITVHVAQRAVEGMFYLCGHWPPHLKWRLPTLELMRDEAARCGLNVDAVLHVYGMPRFTSKAECIAAQHSLVGVLDSMETCAALLLDNWPSDPYGSSLTSLFQDRQLRLRTSADSILAEYTSYSERIANAAWCEINSLTGSEEGARCRSEKSPNLRSDVT